jgi:hypothetical protein
MEGFWKSLEMKAAYDVPGGIRGKYAAASARGSHAVLPDPKLNTVFSDSKAVNDNFRAVLEAGE